MILRSGAAEPSSCVKEAVLHAENDWKVAILHADRSTLDKPLSADLSYTHSSAKTQTKEQLIQDATSGATVYQSIEFENTKIRQYGSVVVITHSAVITTVQTHEPLVPDRSVGSGEWPLADGVTPGDQASLASSLLRGCEPLRCDFGQIATGKSTLTPPSWAQSNEWTCRLPEPLFCENRPSARS